MSTPILATILKTNEHYVDYQLSEQARSLEWHIDNEWNAELVLLAPCGHLESITEMGVTGEDMRIVSAGVTGLRDRADLSPDLSELSDERNNWLLLGDPRAYDAIKEKLIAALNAGCKVIVCLPNSEPETVSSRLREVASSRWSQIVVALLDLNLDDVNATGEAVKQLRENIQAIEQAARPRVIVCGQIDAKRARLHIAHGCVDGFLLLDYQYNDFMTIIEVLKEIGG